MRRSALTVLAALAVLAPATFGQAATGTTAGVCAISGRVDYAAPHVKTLPATVSYTVTGTLTCEEQVRADTAAVGINRPVGFFAATGSGSIGCAASIGGGNFTMEMYPTLDATTRDIWSGTFQNGGLSIQALSASVSGIRHEKKIGSSWVAQGTETIVSSVAGGEFNFGIELDDVNTCNGAGIKFRSFQGYLAYAIATQ